jgi:hypothetical protein
LYSGIVEGHVMLTAHPPPEMTFEGAGQPSTQGGGTNDGHWILPPVQMHVVSSVPPHAGTPT